MIVYTASLQGITPTKLSGGFFAGWKPKTPSPETHLRILLGSAKVVLALEGETGPVVGFVTAVSDGVLAAYIPFLEVLPSHRGRGIGKELVRRILAELGNLYMVDLLCDAELQPYYEKLGMQKSLGMVIRNYARPSGFAK